MKVHPAANLFPLMDDASFADFKEDIRAHGQREPILVDEQGRILDGRNRARACQDIGLPPRTRQWDGKGSAVELVISLNLHRRHMTDQQRQMIAAEALPLFEKEAADRLKTAKPGVRGGSPGANAPQAIGKARDKAAKAFGVGGRGVSDAKRLLGHAPEKAEAVKSGQQTMPQAEKHASEEKRAATTLPFVNAQWQYYHVVEAESLLEQFPEVEQQEIKGMIARFNDYAAMHPASALDILRNLRKKPPKDRFRIYELSKAKPESADFDLAMTSSWDRPPMPDRRMNMLRSVAHDLRKVARIKQDKLTGEISTMAERAEQMADSLRNKTQPRKELLA